MSRLGLFCFLALLVVAQAAYQPVAPQRGSYTWELIIEEPDSDVFIGGKTIYDFVSGYVRMESWNTPDATPGIDGITIWDLRESTPIVTTIDANAQCWVEKLSDDVRAPAPEDFSAYKFKGFKYHNRALAEEWIEPYGGYLFVDVFNRDIVGQGNATPDEDGTTTVYNVHDWSDETPDGTLFLLPNTLQCKMINNTAAYNHAYNKQALGVDLKCAACKTAIGIILGRVGCGAAGAAVCAPFPPAIPFCSLLAQAACKAGGKLGAATACKLIKLCN